MIDDILPVRENYRPPSPVGYESVSPLTMSPRGRDNDNKSQ